MPSRGTMGAYPAFPPAIALSGVGCIRVTHPCATLEPRRALTVRLACIRPAASVHPEPGSNSSLYYCTTDCFFPEISGLAVCSFRLSSLPAPRLAADAPLTFLCWPSSFQRTLANSPRFSAPRSFRLRVQKYYIFPYLQQLFSLFFNIFTFYLNIREINFTLFAKVIVLRRFSCGKRGFRGLFRGRNATFSARFPRVSGGNPRTFLGLHDVTRRPGTDPPRVFFEGHLIIYSTCPSLSQIFHKSDNMQISNKDSRFRIMTHYKKRIPCFVNHSRGREK